MGQDMTPMVTQHCFTDNRSLVHVVLHVVLELILNNIGALFCEMHS